jgi:hypothetical protein
MKIHTIILDRLIAMVLFFGALFVTLDLRHSISTSHYLWESSLIRYVIFPLGLVILAFWGAAVLPTLSKRVLRIGWIISISWHFGWLILMTLSVYGIYGMLTVAPILLIWQIVAGVLSIIAYQSLRKRIA